MVTTMDIDARDDRPDAPESTPDPARTPPTRRSLTFDHDAVVKQVLSWYTQDLQDRLDWSDRRLQRYAKLRGWLEPKQYPWPDASNVYLPLMMTDSLQMQDTLHNGVMSQRPVMNPQPFNPADKDKAEVVADLLDYQMFVEQQGEEKLATLIESFVNDGTMYSLQAWIHDEQDTEQVETYPPLEATVPVAFQLETRIQAIFSEQTNATIMPGNTPWSWDVKWFDENKKPRTAKVDFYSTDDGRLLCVVKRQLVIFDGPSVQPKTEEDIVYPSRAENLQPPSPSNPAGAHHVALVDYPSKDEIKRLLKSKYYDLPDAEARKRFDEEAINQSGGTNSAEDPEQHKVQRDALAGQTYGNSELASQTYTRLMVFARWDVDGDGLDENVVFWILREHNLLLRARLMQEIFPSREGRRPLMSEQFIPVPGQIRGIGLLELLEQIQDSMKILVDQTIDKNTLVNTPWFTFRPASGVRPEVIRIAPGEGYPLADPQRDLNFPIIPNADQTMSLNLLAMFNQWAERQAVIGELQFGRVPQGKASALRTTSGMMSVLQQGAARPERIIRRFFMGLAEIYTQMHELNTIYLQSKKQYRVLGMATPGADPYRTLDDPSKIKGRFQFEFKANSLNTNKAVKGQILQQLGAMTFNPMTFQMQLTDADKYYNWLKDIYAENGQDPNRYLNPPTPQSAQPKISAEQAMGCLLNGVIPEQLPSEGPQMHLYRLKQLWPQLQKEGAVDTALHLLYNTYIEKVQSYQAQAQQLAQASAQFSGMLSGQGGGQPAQGGDAQAGSQMTPQPPGQLNDESLPGAGGGGNPGPMGML
jgi:hypothetical protein